jgi:hypothetical protein
MIQYNKWPDANFGHDSQYVPAAMAWTLMNAVGLTEQSCTGLACAG